jgi:hypothetical protein
MIERKQRFRLTEMNPEPRRHAADEPERAIGATGDRYAREGYSVLDRYNPRSALDQGERTGRGDLPMVTDGDQAEWNERTPAREVY